MPTQRELDNLRRLVADVERVLEGKDFKQVLGALGVLLTRFIASVPQEKRAEVFELIVDGVLLDVEVETTWDFHGWRQ